MKVTYFKEQFYDKKKLLNEKERELNEADERRTLYLDILVGSDTDKIVEAVAYKKNKEREIRTKYNMSVENFFIYAYDQLEKAKGKIDEGQILVDKITDILWSVRISLVSVILTLIAIDQVF